MSIVVVFFKQKTAYEMRISDWSSDVCSSDLAASHLSGGVDAAIDLTAHFLADYHKLPYADLRPHLYTLPQDNAVRHAFRVASGLDSSEERRVGKECVSTCRSRWSPYT